MRKKLLIGSFVATGLVLAMGVTPAIADTTDSTVSGGDLTSTTSGATLTGVALNGTSTQTATGTATSQWSVTDARGTGAAWAVSVTASVPTSAPGTVETVERTIDVSNLTITPGPITAAAGADPVSTTLTAPALAMSGVSQPLISSTGENKGTYNVTPTFSLAIPANAYRSNYATDTAGALNPYTSTVTYTIG